MSRPQQVYECRWCDDKQSCLTYFFLKKEVKDFIDILFTPRSVVEIKVIEVNTCSPEFVQATRWANAKKN